MNQETKQTRLSSMEDQGARWREALASRLSDHFLFSSSYGLSRLRIDPERLPLQLLFYLSQRQPAPTSHDFELASWPDLPDASGFAREFEIHGARIDTLEQHMAVVAPMLQRIVRRWDYPDHTPGIESPRYAQEKLLEKVAAAVDALEASFDDPGDRLAKLVELKESLRAFWRLARQISDRYLSDVAGMLYDATRNLYAEKMTLEQLKTLRNVIRSLQTSSTFDIEAVQRIDRELHMAGLESLPV